MPKSPTSSTRTAFGKRLADAREKAGLRLDNAAVFAQVELQSSYGPSRETIRRMEIGAVDEDRADMMVVAALAKVYKVPMEQLSPLLASRLAHVSNWATPMVTAPKKRASRPAARTARKPTPRPNSRWSRTTQRAPAAA